MRSSRCRRSVRHNPCFPWENNPSRLIKRQLKSGFVLSAKTELPPHVQLRVCFSFGISALWRLEKTIDIFRSLANLTAHSVPAPKGFGAV
jgi:hypothetical protein